MKRISLDDGSGRWFNPEKAQSFEEDTWFDGRNQVSVATSDQFLHEMVFKTAKGRYILHAWSDWQGSKDSYVEISQEVAVRWLLTNGHHNAVDPATLQGLET